VCQFIRLMVDDHCYDVHKPCALSASLENLPITPFTTRSLSLNSCGKSIARDSSVVTWNNCFTDARMSVS